MSAIKESEEEEEEALKTSAEQYRILFIISFVTRKIYCYFKIISHNNSFSEIFTY